MVFGPASAPQQTGYCGVSKNQIPQRCGKWISGPPRLRSRPVIAELAKTKFRSAAENGFRARLGSASDRSLRSWQKPISAALRKMDFREQISRPDDRCN